MCRSFHMFLLQYSKCQAVDTPLSVMPCDGKGLELVVRKSSSRLLRCGDL